MTHFLTQLISAVIGTVAFALLFKVRAKYLYLTAIGGGVGYSVYYLFATVIGASSFIAALISVIFIAGFSEISARIVHAPAPVFLLPCLITIVPGGNLYYAMKGMISRDISAAGRYGFEALKIGLGIAGGIVVVSVIVNLVMGISESRKRRKNGEK